MVATLPQPKEQERPWRKYQGEPDWKDLIPGYAGSLDDDQLARIQEALRRDDALSYWWGFRPGQKTRSAEAIRRIAMSGNPEVRAENVKLARTQKVLRRSFPGHESPSVSTRK